MTELERWTEANYSWEGKVKALRDLWEGCFDFEEAVLMVGGQGQREELETMWIDWNED